MEVAIELHFLAVHDAALLPCMTRLVETHFALMAFSLAN
jgi:hypothetical protein